MDDLNKEFLDAISKVPHDLCDIFQKPKGVNIVVFNAHYVCFGKFYLF